MKEQDFKKIDLNDLRNRDDLFRVKGNTSGQVIKAFRHNFQISQKELCEITGINEKNLSAIENDRRDIGVHSAKKIAAFFGIDSSSLLFPRGIEETLNEYKDIRTRATRLLKRKMAKNVG